MVVAIITGGLRCGLLSLYHLAKRKGLKTSLIFRFTGGIFDNLEARGSIIFSPYLLYEWESVQVFFKGMKSLRLAVILRDPAERAFSLWKSNLMYGLEFKSDFEQALQIENKRFYSSKFKEVTGVNFWRYMYFRGGLYSFSLQKLRDFQGNLRIFTFEEIFHKGEIMNIFDFLDIDADEEKLPHFGKSLIPAVPKVQLILRRMNDGVFLKIPMHRKISDLMMKLNLFFGKDLTHHWCVDFLKEAYKYEVERLNKEWGVSI